MHACDFPHSYLTFLLDSQVQPAITQSSKPNHTSNHVRILLDCICELTPEGGETVQYVLGASCKTERVNVAEGIWLQPNADFCLTASREHFLVIKTYDHSGRKKMSYPPSLGEQPHRQSGLTKDAWAKFGIEVKRTEGQQLETVQEVIDATLAGRPLVAVTELDTDDGYHARLEYPVKTMNVGQREMFYQTDTGPILFPRKPSGHKLAIESFELAYIAANSPDWAELILRSPSAVSSDITVQHYCEPLRIDCKNKLVALPAE